MDRDEIEEIIRKVLGKSNSNIAHPSSQYAAGGLGSLNNMNHEEFLRENLNSYFLQKMQQQQQASAPLPEPSASQSAAPKNGTEDIKVALSLPDVEGLMKFFIENMSSNQEEKAKRLALEKEAEEMRRMIRSFEDMSKKSEAAAAQKKLDAFEDFNAMKSQKSNESLQEFLARCLSDIMLKEVPTKKKVLNDPKWFPGTSKNPEYSNTNSSAEKPMFKDMLKNSSNDGLPQQGPNFSPQPGPSGQFQGGPNFQPPPYQEHAPPPYHQNPYPMPGVPYPWPGHGGPPHQPHMMGYGAPGPFGWQGPPSGYQHPRGPYPGPMPPQKQKQQQNQPKQKQQQNQPKQKQPNQQQNQPKQKQPNQQQKQPNQQTQQQNQQKQQNQPKQNQKNQQNQVPGNVPPTQEMSKKKKNTQNQEPNKKGAQPKLTVPVGSCVNLSPNSSASCNLGSDNLGGIKLSPKEINELKQTIKLMNENASKNNTNNNLGGETNVGKKKKRSKGKSGGGAAAAASNDNDDENDDDSGSGEEGKKEGGSDEAAKKVVPPGQGKKKKNKNKNNEGGSQSPSSGFSLYVGDRWPTLADINSGRLKLDQPVKNILMVAKTPSGDVSATPKMIQDMLVFNKLHPNAMLVFTSD